MNNCSLCLSPRHSLIHMKCAERDFYVCKKHIDSGDWISCPDCLIISIDSTAASATVAALSTEPVLAQADSATTAASANVVPLSYADKVYTNLTHMRQANLKPIIESIHESSVYGNFIEMGAGQPLANLLFGVGGASNTVNFCLSPYSRWSQIARYENEQAAVNTLLYQNLRSVSLEAVKWMLETESRLNTNPHVNLFWVSSFQLKEDLDECSHGWIGYRFIDSYNLKWQKFYHLTFPNGLNRGEMIRELGRASLYLLFNIQAKFAENKTKLDDERALPVPYIDGIFSDNDYSMSKLNKKWDYRSYDLDELIHNLDRYGYFVIGQSGWNRLETKFRSHKTIMIYKGSFNPIHQGHLGLVTQAKNFYPEAAVALMISINTYQKKSVQSYDLAQRIRDIVQLGLDVIITNQGMYDENIQDLQWRLPLETQLVFLAGWDTYVRMEDRLFSDTVDDVEYLIFDRDQKMPKNIQRNRCKFIEYNCRVSSTELREPRFLAKAKQLNAKHSKQGDFVTL